MKEFTIKKQLKLCIEQSENNIRLIVLEGGKELVCRKERLSIVQAFLAEKKGRIFKGRLQLEHSANQLQIIVKNQIIGSIDCQLFENALKNRESFINKDK